MLKQALYSIAYAAPLALSNKTQPKTLGVTIASLERDIYYGGKFINLGEFNDRDPQQLAAKVTEKGGRPGFVASTLSGGTRQMADGVRDARVVQFKAGTTMTVKRVDVKDNRLFIELYDEFTTKGDASTALIVEWGAAVSKADVEKQVARFLEFK